MNDPYLGTTPFHISDVNSFYKLCNDAEIRKEFINMRLNSVDEAKHHLQNLIEISNNSSPSFFKAIRIIFDENAGQYTDSNSRLIGFVSLHDAGMMDSLLTGGFQQNLSFGIESPFRGKGLMTIALQMTLDAMYQDGYNLVPAFVKPNNPASERVLEKCNFTKVQSTPMGSLFIRRICMPENQFKQALGL
jgi:RimJ/RimL family protein N-acetyltransferase